MKICKLYKIVTSFTIILAMLYLNVSVDLGVLFKKDAQNRHFIQVGAQEVYAAQNLYTYQKYSIINTYSLSWTFTSSSDVWGWGSNPTTYSYYFDMWTGAISTAGSNIIPEGNSFLLVYQHQGRTLYNAWNGNFLRCDVGDYIGYISGYPACKCNFYKPTILYNPIKNSLIATVQALDGTYPDNGKHTDGYWYVKGSLITRIPELNVISPAQNGTLFPNSDKTERSV